MLHSLWDVVRPAKERSDGSWIFPRNNVLIPLGREMGDSSESKPHKISFRLPPPKKNEEKGKKKLASEDYLLHQRVNECGPSERHLPVCGKTSLHQKGSRNNNHNNNSTLRFGRVEKERTGITGWLKDDE